MDRNITEGQFDKFCERIDSFCEYVKTETWNGRDITSCHMRIDPDGKVEVDFKFNPEKGSNHTGFTIRYGDNTSGCITNMEMTNKG